METYFDLQCPVCKTSHVPRQQQKTGGIFSGNCEQCGHFFKYRTVPPYKTSVSFTVNGRPYTAGNEFGPTSTLSDFLREKRVSMGTKIMCKQGGCGACIVTANMQLSPTHPKVAANLNSCLCPLFLCDNWEITTVEGLGSSRLAMHQIQENLANYGGTQCGYCSPGQVMNMYGLTQKYPNMNKQFVEDNFDGNICRCTGYRPILDAFKALVPNSSTDIEDLTTKMCINNPEKPCQQNGHCSGSCNTDTTVKPVRMDFGSVQWFKAVDYADLLRMLQTHSGKKIRLLGANTGTGAFWSTENIGNFEIVIDISGVSEFYINTYNSSAGSYTIGANVALSDLMDIFAKFGNTGGFYELKKYLYRVASSPIRNRATWAGNLMLKNHIPTFPSDVFNIMTVLNASLHIGPTPQDVVTPDAFLSIDMTGKALSKATFDNIPGNDVVACFKVMPRSQNSLALVNGAFRCTVDPQNNYTVSGQPVISIGGISGTFHRAKRTEAYLVGKQLSAPQTLTGAMGILQTELVPSNDIRLPSPAYRKMVACALVYKYFLQVLGNTAGTRYRSGRTVLHDVRPLSSGTQTYDTKHIEWPLTQPLKKLEADIQCTGEAQYADDIPPLPGQLYAAFVKSTQANASIQNVDKSPVVGMVGVYQVLTAADIPAGGQNNLNGPSFSVNTNEPEKALASGEVNYYGQPIAIVLADTQEIADQAAAMVKVTYANISAPIIDIDDAIQKQSIIPNPGIKDLVVGDADQAIAMSSHVTSGTFYMGNQYHFYMETQCSLAVPSDDGLEIIATTQWTEPIQHVVAQICGAQKNKVNVTVKRIGGGFSGKVDRNKVVSAACGLAAYLTNRPVRMRLSMWDNMEMLGKRYNYKADYQVGHDATGKLNGVNVTYYREVGYLKNPGGGDYLYGYLDNGYFCPNWKAKVVALKTNKPFNTACRSPGSLPAIFFMEQMMEHIARTLNKDAATIKALNFYKQGQVTPVGMTLHHCNLDAVMNELMTSAQVSLRQTTLEYFNTNNRWKKKGLSVVPMKWGVNRSYTKYSVLVNIESDGTVLVHHGGIEMGQGINTKVAQVCAYELGLPVANVFARGSNTVMEVNNANSGGSVTSESCCQGVITCCANLKQRMAPIKAKLVNPTWIDLVNKCLSQRIVLSEKVVNVDPDTYPLSVYNSYGAACSEVELDVLTGEYQVNRVDIVYDCGESMNPAIDVGQVEGGFIMGMGYSTCEDIKYDKTTGRLLTNDTWTYHPPTSKDIPIDFRISLLKNAPNPLGVLRSKACGEPPLDMSCSVFFALKKCIEEARKETGDTSYFSFNAPATVEKVQLACNVNTAQFRIQ